MRGGLWNRTFALLLLGLAVLGAGTSAAQTLQRIDVYEYGTYVTDQGVEEQPTRLGIERQRVTGAKHLETARTIIAQLGTQFGFRYRVVGTPNGAPVALRVVAKFPPPGVMGKNNPKPVFVDDYVDLAFVGREDFLTWTFEKRTDLVPGIWTFEIWSGDRKLAEEKFNIVLPPIS
jgi:hypothetical protein